MSFLSFLPRAGQGQEGRRARGHDSLVPNGPRSLCGLGLGFLGVPQKRRRLRVDHHCRLFILIRYDDCCCFFFYSLFCPSSSCSSSFLLSSSSCLLLLLHHQTMTTLQTLFHLLFPSFLFPDPRPTWGLRFLLPPTSTMIQQRLKPPLFSGPSAPFSPATAGPRKPSYPGSSGPMAPPRSEHVVDWLQP